MPQERNLSKLLICRAVGIETENVPSYSFFLWIPLVYCATKHQEWAAKSRTSGDGGLAGTDEEQRSRVQEVCSSSRFESVGVSKESNDS